MILELIFGVLLLLLLALFILGVIYLCLILIVYIKDELREMKEREGNG